jgi:hypothetical protein
MGSFAMAQTPASPAATLLFGWFCPQQLGRISPCPRHRNDMTPQELLLPLPTAQWAEFSRQPMLGRHLLERSDLFCDAALIELLDRFPRHNMHALNMGDDPEHPEQNRPALHAGVNGTELLRAVRRGRLWLNLTHIEQADARYRALIDALYVELAAHVPGFRAQASQGTLLISSPRALVYYHVDGPASVLWHLRGRKRVWVYPANQPRFVGRDALEDIIAGARHEYLPFKTAFDDAAMISDLEPGQWIAWPQNAPHRITNHDSLNVSLSTEHFTARSRRRSRVHAANRFLRLRCGMAGLSAREDGAVALFKTVLHAVARRTGLDRTAPKRHMPTLYVDADAPEGVRPLSMAGVPAQVVA